MAVVAAQPFPLRTSDTVWATADAARTRVYGALLKYLDDADIDALVVKSVDFTIPAWVELRAWMPEGEAASNRVRLTIWIVPKPYFRFPLEITLAYWRRWKEHRIQGLISFTEEDAAKWAAYVLGRGSKPRYASSQLRAVAYQFWRPFNKVERLGVDPFIWLTIGLGLLAIVAAATLLANRPAGVLLGLVTFASAAFVGFRSARRSTLVVNSGKPEGEPRSLSLVDSWHVTLLGLGGDANSLRERVKVDFSKESLPGLSIREEQVAFVGVDGKQERDQLVLRLGRSLLFCHIYAYGSDLFVGWDAYANLGEWSESQIAAGYDWRRRAKVVIYGLQTALYRLTEYDLIDLDCLVEWNSCAADRAREDRDGGAKDRSGDRLQDHSRPAPVPVRNQSARSPRLRNRGAASSVRARNVLGTLRRS